MAIKIVRTKLTTGSTHPRPYTAGFLEPKILETGWFVGWGLTALLAQLGHIVP